MQSDQRYDAMIEFIGCFPTVSGSKPSHIKELNDGVVLFEALSDISPEHFDTSAISREGNNWALKANNFRKLVRNLESYFHDELHKTTDFDRLSDSISSIVRQEDIDAIASFIEVIIAAAVTCTDKGRYVGWIMEMGGDNQMCMKSIIESSLALLDDLDDGEVDGDSDEIDGMDDGMISDDEFSGGAEMTKFFGNAMKDLDSATYGMDGATAYSGYSGNDGSMSMGGGGGVSRDIIRERDELRAALAESKRELAAQKSNALTVVEDNESTQKKLRALATDLQERLQRRDEELTDAEEKLVQTRRSLEDAEGKMSDLTEKNTTLEDELDISNAKALQLKKAEATVVAYRRKLEGAGVMNQQMNDLENQSAKYVGQIMDLEMETKKIPELQKTLEVTQRELKKTEKEKETYVESVSVKTAEIAKLKTELSASVAAKKTAEEEVTELRSMQESGQDHVEEVDVPGLSLTSAQSVSEVKEKNMRLKIENEKLQKKLTETTAVAAAAAENGAKNSADEAAIQALENEITALQAELKKKETATAKLASDKDKLETYTKKTLSKFQEKYLVALQECKAKLKEKHDKIEALEMRSAAEKSSQKREEKLLSSTMFELGLVIMQNQLKGRS